jgi:hypothetical protein
MSTTFPTVVQPTLLTDAQIAKGQTWIGPLNLTYLSRARQLYVSGFACEEIADRYPEYPLSMLYKACGEHRWPEARILENQRLATHSVSSAGIGQPKALIFMNRVIEAVYTRYEKKLLDYATDPERSEFPQIAKSDFDQIERAISIAREIMGLHQKASRDGSAHNGKPTVNIVLKSKDAAIIEIDQDEVADKMIAEMKAAKALRK